MRGQRAFGRGMAQAMNEAAQRRIKNPPPRSYARWVFAAAAVLAVVARAIYVSDGPRLVAQICISAAVILAVVSLVLRIRAWRKSRARK
ncbi:hypothetical protein [Arthrobacter psychrolactophilus]